MKTCLVVDDSRVVRKVARRILEGLSFAVEEAADGLFALEACLQAMPDAVLLDWDMPRMNGIEFLRRLRATEGGKTPVVVFCTSHSDIGHIQEAMGSGADEYVMKPFDGDILEAKLLKVGLL
ncbi:MAG TPA: response regulator [Stellaceae bacterium]|nr:response regulator [Stellaceae bacterium]